MFNKLPDYYENSRVMQQIQQAIGAEIDLAQTAMVAVFEQFFVELAVDWGLKIWENELELQAVNLTLSQRKNQILAKLRSHGTLTPSKLATIMASFEKGEIDVFFDWAAFVCYAKFVDVDGIPDDISGFKARFEEIIQAHYTIDYLYKWLIWNVLDGFNWTWDELDALNFTWDQLEVYHQ